MVAKTGIPTLHDLAASMCKYLTKYSALIAFLHSENTALIAALAAAKLACAELEAELLGVRDYGD